MYKTVKMQHQTQVDFSLSTQHITYDQSILSIGSCFADLVGKQLTYHGFNTLNNPFGVVYNPQSLALLLDNSLNSTQLDEDRFTLQHDVYQHFDLHSQLGGMSIQDITNTYRTQQNITNQYVTTANWLIITLGSAIVYRHLPTGKIVNNCHKVPQATFRKEMLSVTTILDRLTCTFDAIRQANANLNIILTVSPVRHKRHGLVDNNRSKARLLIAAEELDAMYDYVSYFPAYELFIDELRDYRYFAEDMVHPSSVAEQVVWQRFKDVYFRDDTLSLTNQVTKLKARMQHRPMYPESIIYQQFEQKLQQDLATFRKANPRINI